ncbi:MAG: cysteine peptidase family C39 domain-containing protein, partial [Armatimonadota bacterium]
KLGVSAVMRRPVTFEELAKLPMPCLATWHLSGTVMHEIAILRVEPDKVEVGDPMMGQMDYTRAEFERQWLRDALVLE